MTSALPGRPFKIDTPQLVLDDLFQRLERTRFPTEAPAAGWRYGTPQDYARRLRDRWMNGFDWRVWEERINRYPQCLVTVDGQEIHVLVEPGSGSDPLPLVLTHGWPGSFLEFLEMIEPLAHPERFGGRVEDAFTVVLPSLPGYGYSAPPPAPITPARIASFWHQLAVDHFGFAKYGAQGGDWGSAVTAALALLHPQRLVGIHLNAGGLPITIDGTVPPMTEEETAWAARAQAVMLPESGYQRIQGTKPQTLAYAQTDSPMGLAAWIVEKFQGWTVPGTAADPPFEMDRLLANIMLYWLNGSNAPSWLYICLNDMAAMAPPANTRVTVPAGFTLFPKDVVVPPPRSWLERAFDVRQYRIAEGGGHFPAMENGDLLLGEIRSFFAPLRR